MVKSRDIAFYDSAVDGFMTELRSQGYDAPRLSVQTIALNGDEKKDKQSIHDHVIGANLIYAVGTDAAVAVFDDHPQSPILFTMVVDPVQLHLVNSLDIPGGSATGTTLVVNSGKQLDALTQIDPAVHKVGVIYTDGDATSLAFLASAQQDAARLNVKIISSPSGEHSKDALEQLAKQVDAFWMILDPASAGPDAMKDTFAVATEHHLPVLGVSSGSVRAGALLALSADVTDLGKVTAQMAAPLLEGTSVPGQMQVRGPRQTTLSINLVTAQSLGLKVPNSILHLADEVIDAKQ